MRFLKKWKVTYKISLTLGVILIISLAVLLFTLRLIGYDKTIQNAEDFAKQNALQHANEIKNTLQEPKVKLELLLQSVMILRESKSIKRDQFKLLLQKYLENTPGLLDVYAAWEPNAFDGLDAEFANKEGYDKTGRLIPKLLKTDGQIVSQTILDDTEPKADWYQIPKNTKKTILLDPYLYPINGNPLLITSIVIPILDSKDEFLGIVGLDLPLNAFQQLTAQNKPLGGYSALLSASGDYIANGLDQSLIGKPYENKDLILSAVEASKTVTLNDLSNSVREKQMFRLFQPILISGIDSHWTFVSVMTKNQIFNDLRYIAAGVFYLSIAIVLFILISMIILVRRLLRPLYHSIEIVDKISNGNLSVLMNEREGSPYEFGKLAAAVNRMTFNLKSTMNDLEAQSEEISAQNDEIVAMNLEIREQSEKQNKMIAEKERIFSLSVDMICIIDFNGYFIDLNPAWEKTTGFTKEELMAKSYRAFLHPDDQERSLQEAGRLKSSEQSNTTSTFVNRFLCKDGTYKSISWNCYVSHEQKATYATARDITEMEKIHLDLVNEKTKAENANRTKTEFLASMSHEIRTPMNAIIGMADLLHETPLSVEQKTYVEVFQRAGNNLLHLINDILDLSKVEAGHLVLESIDFELESLLEQTVEILAIRAHTKKLELLSYIAPDIPKAVCGDPERLRQVLFNLVGNAIKFTEKGEIVVKAEMHPKEPEMLLFSVSDTGIGIPQSKLDSIFELFSQGDSSVTRRYGGTGLGLAICKKIAEKMDGEVWVESIEGKGSTFFFSAKFTASSGDLIHDQPVSQLLNGLKTLVVDDNSTNRFILREMLSKHGVLVTETKDARDGLIELERAKNEGKPYALLLLDCMMPDMDGFEMLEQLKSENNSENLTIMMLTSDDQINSIKRCKELGVSYYMVKPIKKSALLRAIGRVTEDPQTLSKSPNEKTESKQSQEPLQILLVEDNADNQLLFQAYLKKTNHRIDLAENGVIACERVKNEDYDLVFMDMQMPVMDGYTATQTIRDWEKENEKKPLKIIALTAHVLKEDMQKCLDAGCSDYLAKPIHKKALLEFIQSHTGMK